MVGGGIEAAAFVGETEAGALRRVDGQDSGVRRTPVRLVDGSMAAHVRFDAVQAHPLTVPAGMWAEAQALAGLSIVAELVGAMASLLDLTVDRSEEHTSELQSLMRISYAVFCLKKKKIQKMIM